MQFAMEDGAENPEEGTELMSAVETEDFEWVKRALAAEPDSVNQRNSVRHSLCAPTVKAVARRLPDRSAELLRVVSCAHCEHLVAERRVATARDSTQRFRGSILAPVPDAPLLPASLLLQPL